MKTLIYVYRFLIHVDTRLSADDYKKKFLELFRLFLLNFLLVILITIPISILRLQYNIQSKGINLSLFAFIFINIVIVPVFEESAFRLSLIYNKIYLCISMLIISFIAISFLLTGEIITTSNLLLRFIYSFSISVILYFLLNKVPKIDNLLAEFWAKNPRKIVYLFILLFVAIHLDEYIFLIQDLPVVLLILTPKLVTGIFLSYTRMRLGFIYGILLHIIINITGLSLMFI